MLSRGMWSVLLGVGALAETRRQAGPAPPSAEEWIEATTNKIILSFFLVVGLFVAAFVVWVLVRDRVFGSLRQRKLRQVSRLTDQRRLAKIAGSRADWAVCRAALDRLTDQSLLGTLAMTAIDARTRQAAVERLSDPTVLAATARTADAADVRLAAVRKLDDEAVLADIATSIDTAEIRQTAIAKLTDQVPLTRIATSDRVADVRRQAVRQLSDQSVLTQIARTDADAHVRSEAASRLTDPATLEDIAAHDDHPVVLETVVQKLAGVPRALANIAKECRGPFVPQHAVDGLRHQPSLLADVARGALETEVRLRAREMLLDDDVAVDQSLLADVFKGTNGDEDHFRGMAERLFSRAVKRVTDPAVFLDLARSSTYEGVRALSVARVVDQSVLAEVVRTDFRGRVRDIAVKRIHDQAVLAEIAATSAYTDVGEAAVRSAHLVDQSLLSHLAQTARDSRIRLEAARRLKDRRLAETYCAAIARNGSAEPFTRREALGELRDQHWIADVAARAAMTYHTGYDDNGYEVDGYWNWDISLAAVSALRDEVSLAEIANTHESPEVRNAARERLGKRPG